MKVSKDAKAYLLESAQCGYEKKGPQGWAIRITPNDADLFPELSQLVGRLVWVRIGSDTLKIEEE